MLLSVQQFLAIMPAAFKRVDTFLDPLNAALAEFQINTPARAAMFLPQLAHESAEFYYMKEIASGADYEGREDLGNTEPEAIRIAAEHGSTPGRWWKGHGPIQTTGYWNHLFAGEKLGLDLLNAPQLLCEPTHGCRSSALFWRNAKLQDGTRVDLNPIADDGDFLKVCRVVNMGLLESSRLPNGWAERQRYFARAQAALQGGV